MTERPLDRARKIFLQYEGSKLHMAVTVLTLSVSAIQCSKSLKTNGSPSFLQATQQHHEAVGFTHAWGDRNLEHLSYDQVA